MCAAVALLSRFETGSAIGLRVSSKSTVVMFFLAVGILFDPSILLRQPLQVLAVLAIVVIGKSLAAFGIVRALGGPTRTAAIVPVALAQIGEFSFILAGLGVKNQAVFSAAIAFVGREHKS